MINEIKCNIYWKFKNEKPINYFKLFQSVQLANDRLFFNRKGRKGWGELCLNIL